MNKSHAIIAAAGKALRDFLREHGATAKRFGRTRLPEGFILWCDTVDGRRAGVPVILRGHR